MKVAYYPDKTAVYTALKNDGPLLMLISFDGEHTVMSPVEGVLEHHLLLDKVGIGSRRINEFFRIIFSFNGAEWVFECPHDYKNINDKKSRIITFYKDGFAAISNVLSEFGFLLGITIPKHYLRSYYFDDAEQEAKKDSILRIRQYSSPDEKVAELDPKGILVVKDLSIFGKTAAEIRSDPRFRDGGWIDNDIYCWRTHKQGSILLGFSSDVLTNVCIAVNEDSEYTYDTIIRRAKLMYGTSSCSETERSVIFLIDKSGKYVLEVYKSAKGGVMQKVWWLDD